MNNTMMMMKKAGKRAVRVSIPESSSPHRCIKMAAIITNFGIAITVRIHKVSCLSVISNPPAVGPKSAPTAATSIKVSSISPKKFIQYASLPMIVCVM